MSALDKLKRIQHDIQEGIVASLPKPARTYFAEIVNLPKDRQEEALQRVPEEKREQVKFYLEDHENKLNGLVSMVLQGASKEERNKLLNRVPPNVKEIVRNRVIASYKPKVQRNSDMETTNVRPNHEA